MPPAGRVCGLQTRRTWSRVPEIIPKQSGLIGTGRKPWTNGDFQTLNSDGSMPAERVRISRRLPG